MGYCEQTSWTGLLGGKAESVTCGGYPCDVYHTARILSLVCASASICGCLYIIIATVYRTQKLGRGMSAVQYFPVYLAVADMVLGFGEIFTLLPLNTPKLDIHPRWCSAQGALWQIGVFSSAFTTAVVAISLVRTLSGRQPLPPGPYFLYYILTGFGIPVTIAVIPLVFLDAYGPGRLRCCMTGQYPELAIVYNFVLPTSLVCVAVGCHIKSAVILRKSLMLRRKTVGMTSRSTRLNELDSCDNVYGGASQSRANSVGGNGLRHSFSAPSPRPVPPMENEYSRGGRNETLQRGSVSVETGVSDISSPQNCRSEMRSRNPIGGVICSTSTNTVEGIVLVDNQEIAKLDYPPKPIAKDGISSPRASSILKWTAAWTSRPSIVLPGHVTSLPTVNESDPSGQVPASPPRVGPMARDYDPQMGLALTRLSLSFVFFALSFMVQWVPYAIYTMHSLILGCTSPTIVIMHAVTVNAGGLIDAFLYRILLVGSRN